MVAILWLIVCDLSYLAHVDFSPVNLCDRSARHHEPEFKFRSRTHETRTPHKPYGESFVPISTMSMCAVYIPLRLQKLLTIHILQ